MRFAVLLADRADSRLMRAHGGVWSERLQNLRAWATGRPEDLDPNHLWWESDGVTEVRRFNEYAPLPVQPLERDPGVRVADVLSPRARYLCRAVSYIQWDGVKRTPMVEMMVVGRYMTPGTLAKRYNTHARDPEGRPFRSAAVPPDWRRRFSGASYNASGVASFIHSPEDRPCHDSPIIIFGTTSPRSATPPTPSRKRCVVIATRSCWAVPSSAPS